MHWAEAAQNQSWCLSEKFILGAALVSLFLGWSPVVAFVGSMVVSTICLILAIVDKTGDLALIVFVAKQTIE